MTGGRWIELVVGALRIDQDRILLASGAPVLVGGDRSAGVRRGYFLRDGAGTPERLRLRLEVEDGAAGAAVRDTVVARLQAQGLGEIILGVDLDDAPVFSEIQGLWEGGGASDLRDDFFADTAPFVLELLAEIAGDPTTRMRAAFDLMVAHADETSRSLFRQTAYPDTFFSYRSHADGFFIMSKDPHATKQLFDARYLRSALALRARLTQILRADVEAMARWRSVLAKYIPRILALLADGHLRLPAGEDQYLGDRFDLSVSPFHKTIHGDCEYRDFMRTDLRFAAMRVLLTCLYWTLQHLGLRLIDRYFLCHGTSKAFEEVFRVDPAAALAAARAGGEGHAEGR